MILFKISQYPTYQVFLTAIIALLATGFLTPLWIKFLKVKQIGQVVRTNGPQQHLFKRGTPTMGGFLILVVVTISFLLIASIRGVSKLGVLALVTMLACGLLGFLDDYSKAIRERSLGLRARTKLFWQFVISVALGWTAINYCQISTDVALPLTSIYVNLGWVYYLLLFLIVTGTSNSVNITDGLDGLAAGTTTIIMLAYAGITFRQGHLDLAILCAAIGGACIGFLWYNSYPAEIFMGDTGSIGIGGTIAALAILTKTELLLVLIAGLYVVETLSVIIQVISYRCFEKRVFKMAPIHHHFEMLGWSETKVMIRFWIVAGVFAGMGFALYFLTTVRGV